MNAIIMILLLTFLCSIPLGIWCKKVMNRDIPWINKVEDWILDRLKISAGEMGWKNIWQELLLCPFFRLWFCLECLSLAAWICPWLLIRQSPISQIPTGSHLIQCWKATGSFRSWDLEFRTISAAIGICVLFALIRGLIAKQKSSLGNLWQDLIGSLLFILLPVNLVGSIILAGQGVPMQMQSYETSALIEPIAVDEKDYRLKTRR